MWDAWRSRLAEAVDFALANGLVKLASDGRLIHAPFTLNPVPIDPERERELAALTPAFNRLALRVAADAAFVRETLEPAAADDPFLQRLLGLAAAPRERQSLQFAINRSDYFLRTREGESQPRAVQVELNTIAVSYAALAERTLALHRFLLADSGLAGALIPNDPLDGIARGLVEAFSRFGDTDAVMLMVVQPNERNRFDQRLLEYRLRERGIRTVRWSLERVGREAVLREGHLAVEGAIAAVTYLRAGYGPDDYAQPDAWRGRERIERSDTVAVPSVALQLAGSKKVQQVLARRDVLAAFCDASDAPRLAATFAGLYDPEQPIPMAEGALPAWRAAIEFPARFVLKPQREGGGNNLFDEEMRAFLEASTARSRAGYILMERIQPEPHFALMVAEGVLREGPGVSEIGRFGVMLAQGNTELLNADAGYLVRTKPADSREGGVSAGFGFLSSLLREGSP
jgi:glutathione synthase